MKSIDRPPFDRSRHCPESFQHCPAGLSAWPHRSTVHQSLSPESYLAPVTFDRRGRFFVFTPMSAAGIVRRLLVLALFLIAIVAVRAEAQDRPAGRAQTSLDAGWRFLRDDVSGASAPGFDDSGWPEVTLPHTYNGADGDDGGTYYRGAGWYRRVLALPRLPAGRRFWLQFDGAALAADIWVNGRRIGRHEGGHAGFRFDVTEALKTGDNILAVRTDNTRLPQIAPLGGDFSAIGGLYRHVWLVEVADVHVDLADHGGPGLYVATTALDDRRADLLARVLLRNDAGRARMVTVRVAVTDRDGGVVATRDERVRLPARAGSMRQIPITVANPHRWRGRPDPYLYTVTASIEGDAARDSVSVPLGLRTAAFDPQRGFMLNGAPYPLHGVNLFHPGRPGRGLAVTDAEVDADMQTIDDLGVTGVRFVHFQHPAEAYDEADRRGFAVWTEIALNGVIDPGKPFEENVSEQMRELIRQNYNHPSVVLWGIGNEVYATTPDVTRVLKAVNAVARAEDSSRPTIYAHCCQSDDNEKAGITDLIGFNRYFGWYPGQTGSIGDWADTYHAGHPSRAFAVSEYGAGASIRQQQVPPPAENVPESGWHPEQAQTAYHESNGAQLAARPWLAATFVWVAFDLASDGRHEGDRPGINDKGLVTYDRAIRKDAFYWYQANWSATPMVHLVDRRLVRRDTPTIEVRAFSNAASATLTINGRSIGTVPVTGHVARWPAVPLAMGDNIATVAAGGASDSVRWQRVEPSPAGASYLPLVRKPKPAGEPDKAPPGQKAAP